MDTVQENGRDYKKKNATIKETNQKLNASHLSDETKSMFTTKRNSNGLSESTLKDQLEFYLRMSYILKNSRNLHKPSTDIICFTTYTYETYFKHRPQNVLPRTASTSLHSISMRLMIKFFIEF